MAVARPVIGVMAGVWFLSGCHGAEEIPGPQARWDLGRTPEARVCLILARPTGDPRLFHRDREGRMVYTRCVAGRWVQSAFEEDASWLAECSSSPLDLEAGALAQVEEGTHVARVVQDGGVAQLERRIGHRVEAVPLGGSAPTEASVAFRGDEVEVLAVVPGEGLTLTRWDGGLTDRVRWSIAGRSTAAPRLLGDWSRRTALYHDGGRGELRARRVDGDRISRPWVVAAASREAARTASAVIDQSGSVWAAVVEDQNLSLWAPAESAACGEPVDGRVRGDVWFP